MGGQITCFPFGAGGPQDSASVCAEVGHQLGNVVNREARETRTNDLEGGKQGVDSINDLLPIIGPLTRRQIFAELEGEFAFQHSVMELRATQVCRTSEDSFLEHRPVNAFADAKELLYLAGCRTDLPTSDLVVPLLRGNPLDRISLVQRRRSARSARWVQHG
jgi:hypothetical protein